MITQSSEVLEAQVPTCDDDTARRVAQLVQEYHVNPELALRAIQRQIAWRRSIEQSSNPSHDGDLPRLYPDGEPLDRELWVSCFRRVQ